MGKSRNFTEQATAMFARFASKHELSYNVLDVPIEVCWEFPIQHKLSERIVLGLQNNDELNFGVGEFWSYFFPFEDKHSEFETLIDKWVAGEARVVVKPGLVMQTRELQVFDNNGWKKAYGASSLSFCRPPPLVLKNLT